MASPTQHTESVRQRKARRSGRARKNALANHGTTLSREELFRVQG